MSGGKWSHSFNHVIEVTAGQEPGSLNTTYTNQCKVCTKKYDCQEYLKKTQVPKRKKEAICLGFYNPENRTNSCAQRRTLKSWFCLHSIGVHDDTLPPNQEVTNQLSLCLPPEKDHASNAHTEVEEALCNVPGTGGSAAAVPRSRRFWLKSSESEVLINETPCSTPVVPVHSFLTVSRPRSGWRA